MNRLNLCRLQLATLLVVAAATVSTATLQAQTVFAPGSQLKELWNEGEFTEGVAVRSDGQVFFSDIPRNPQDNGRILQFDPTTELVTVASGDSGKSNGLYFDEDDRLFACCGANGGAMALCIVHAEGEVEPIVNLFNGKRFNSPNDLVIHPSGRIYFSDPRYVGNEPIELDMQSVYMFDLSIGRVIRVTRDITKPNGVHVSPDGKTLYVAETDNGSTGEGRPITPKHMTLNAFDIAEDGRLSNRRVLVDFGEKLGVDGMTLDSAGRIYAAVRSEDSFGIVVYSPEGEELDRLKTPSLPTNCCFGKGPTANILYVTAGGGLYQVNVPGANR